LWPAVLRAVLASGEVEEVGGRVVHRDHLDAYRAGRRTRREQLLAALAGPELTFVDADRVVDEHGMPRFEVQPLLDAGELLQRDGLLFTPGTVERAIEALDAGPGAAGARSPPPTPARPGSSPAATPSPCSNTCEPPGAPPSTAPTTAA
jgi:hypothetical protein